VKRGCEKLKIEVWCVLSVSGHKIFLEKEADLFMEASKLDGCYVLKTDLSSQMATKEVVHERYKDLALMEWAFRSSKTVQLEMRPIHVRLATRTCGHAFEVMMAYRIIKELASCWQDLNVTVEEGIKELTTFCAVELCGEKVAASCHQIPQPRESIQRLLSATGVRLPRVLPSRGVIVTTKKKLQKRRKIK
jgi:hypothetical protein